MAFKKTLLIIIILLLCILILTDKSQTTIQTTSDKLTIPTTQQIKNLPGTSPEGLPTKIARAQNIIISPAILKEAENPEKGLMLDGSDIAIIPANKSTTEAVFDVKLFSHQECVLLSLKTENEQNYITLHHTPNLLNLRLCLAENTNVPNVSREFSYSFINKLTKDWTSVKISLTQTFITLVLGSDVLKEARHPKDTILPTAITFFTLTVGGESYDDDAFAACRWKNLNFFGTKFGEFLGTHPAIFPVNLRKHLTIYPIDISFTLNPVSDGTLLVIYENDKNYLKLFLQDFRLKSLLKSKDRKHFHAFNHILEKVPVSVKILIDNHITVNFLKALESHSTVVKERSTEMQLSNTDIYWLSSASRLFLGGVPLFPKENFKGTLTDVSFRDTTSLF